MTIEKSFTGGMEGLQPIISASSEPSPALEKRIAGSSGSSDVVGGGGRSRLKRKKASANNTGDTEESPCSSNNSNNKTSMACNFGVVGGGSSGGGGSGGGKKQRINIDSVVKQFTSSVNVTTSKQRMGGGSRKTDEGNKRLKFVMTERTNLNPVKKQSTGKGVGVDATDDTTRVLDAATSQGHDSEDQQSKVTMIKDPTIPLSPPPVKKARAKRNKASKVMPRKRSKDDTAVGLRKSMRLFVKSNRFEASRAKRAPCPGSPFGRTVELLTTNCEELNRDCEITKILFLSSLNVIPTFARSTPEIKVASLKTQCIQAHIRYLNSLKEQKDQETQKTLVDKSSSDDESSSSSSSISSNEIEPTPTPSDPEDEEEDWMDMEESLGAPTRGLSPEIITDELENTLKDCVTKLLRRGNFVNFVGVNAPPYLEEIIRTMSPKTIEEDSLDDQNYEWNSCSDSSNSLVKNACDRRTNPLKRNLSSHISRKGRVNRVKKSNSYSKISTASALLTAI